MVCLDYRCLLLLSRVRPCAQRSLAVLGAGQTKAVVAQRLLAMVGCQNLRKYIMDFRYSLEMRIYGSAVIVYPDGSQLFVALDNNLDGVVRTGARL